MPSGPPVLAAAFLVFLVATAVALALFVRPAIPPRRRTAFAIALALWLAYVGALSALGVVRDPSLRPPGVVAVVGPAVLFVLVVVALSREAGAVARRRPLALLIGFQVFRVGVELFFHALWGQGLAPRMLTYDGANVDIWIGASAPLAAWLATRGRGGLNVALAWNVAGLLALANVAARAALTAPGPLHMIDAEVPNLTIGVFPYTYIAGFFAPLAAALHVLALRAIAARRASPQSLEGAPA